MEIDTSRLTIAYDVFLNSNVFHAVFHLSVCFLITYKRRTVKTWPRSFSILKLYEVQAYLDFLHMDV